MGKEVHAPKTALIVPIQEVPHVLPVARDEAIAKLLADNNHAQHLGTLNALLRVTPGYAGRAQAPRRLEYLLVTTRQALSLMEPEPEHAATHTGAIVSTRKSKRDLLEAEEHQIEKAQNDALKILRKDAVENIVKYEYPRVYLQSLEDRLNETSEFSGEENAAKRFIFLHTAAIHAYRKATKQELRDKIKEELRNLNEKQFSGDKNPNIFPVRSDVAHTALITSNFPRGLLEDIFEYIKDTTVGDGIKISRQGAIDGFRSVTVKASSNAKTERLKNDIIAGSSEIILREQQLTTHTRGWMPPKVV